MRGVIFRWMGALELEKSGKAMVDIGQKLGIDGGTDGTGIGWMWLHAELKL
jgi:hypothetical protein